MEGKTIEKHDHSQDVYRLALHSTAVMRTYSITGSCTQDQMLKFHPKKENIYYS